MWCIGVRESERFWGWGGGVNNKVRLLYNDSRLIKYVDIY